MNLIDLQVLVALMELLAGFVAPLLPGHNIQETDRLSSAMGGLRTTQIGAEAFSGRDEHAFPDPTPAEATRYESVTEGRWSAQPSAGPSPVSTETAQTPSPSPSPTGTKTTTDTRPTAVASSPSEKSSPSPTSTTTAPTASPSPTATTNSPSPTQTTSPSPTASSTTPASTPATPTFSTHYETWNGNPNNLYEVYMTVKITPTDLAGKTVNGLRIDLAGQGFSTPYEGNHNLNGTGWGAAADWSCTLGGTSSCQGTTGLNQGVKSQFIFFFSTSLANAPATLNVTLLSGGQALTTLAVPKT